MTEDQSAPQDAWPPSQALLDVKGGLGWSAARVPVELNLVDGRLRIKVTGDDFSRKERKALGRLFGAEADAGSIQALNLEVDTAAAEIEFPRAPGRRSWIVIQVADKPTFRIYFLDWKELEKRPGSLVGIGKHAADSRSAAAAREAWRAQLERKIPERR